MKKIQINFTGHIECPSVSDDEYLTLKQRLQAIGVFDNKIMKMKEALTERIPSIEILRSGNNENYGR